MKKNLLIIAPVGTRSGYGDHARDLFHSFNDLDMFNIKVSDVRWGDTPRNALDSNNQKDKKIIDCILKPGEQLSQQPDVCVDIRIPNEFQPVGKFNIGITAGIETDVVSPQFIEGCNRMDLIIVPSEHSKSGFVNAKFDKQQPTPDGKQQKIGELTLEKPIEVLFEGYNEKFKNIEEKEIPQEFTEKFNNFIKEDFAFLFVGQWCQGGFGEDRKDIGRMIKIFYETFLNSKEKPALLLKTSGATYSILDREDCISKIKSVKESFPKKLRSKLPNVYLLHGELSLDELNYLYNHPKIKSMVSFTHGEGFGRPLLEATITGLPVVASGWSGQVDFLHKDYSYLVNGSLNQVPKSAVWENIIIPESKWFSVDEKQASEALKFSYENSEVMRKKSNILSDINSVNFSHENMTKKLKYFVEKYTSHLPTQVGLKLPQLKKVKTDKVKLPKLPKMEKTFPNI